jgi:hypothetical protein
MASQQTNKRLAMIHYHGSPLGAGAGNKHNFWGGRHALVSFAYPQDLSVCLEVCQSVVLDNGAFTTWKQGRKFDFNAYGEWVERLTYHPAVDWWLIPDIIDGEEADNKALASEWMRHKANDFAVPVYHMHESFSYLSWLIDNFPTIALGSSGAWPTPNARIWWDRMADIMDFMCDEHGRAPVKLHGLRMLNPKVFQHLPLSSADSVNAAMNSGDTKRYGMYVPPARAQRANIIADRIEQYQSAPVWAGKPGEKE